MSSLSPEVERRRRLVTRAAPISLVALVAFILGAIVGTPGSPAKDAARRFVDAWGNGEFATMYKELNSASRRSIELNDFVAAYREAEDTATVRGLNPHSPGDPKSGSDGTIVPVAITVDTMAFGSLEGGLDLPYSEGGIDWDASLVFPGLRPGEHLESQIELAPREPILAADGTPLAEGPAEARAHPIGSDAIDVTGEVGAAEERSAETDGSNLPPGTPAGISGLERASTARLGAKPGGSLFAVSEEGSARPLAKAEPQPGAPVKTT